VYRQLGANLLHVSIRARVKVRPLYIRRPSIIRRRKRCGRIDVVRAKYVSRTYRAKRADGTAKIHVIAREQNAATASPEAQDASPIFFVEPVSGVDRE